MSQLTQVLRRIRHHEITAQFVRYAVVGCFNVLLFFALFNAFTSARESRVHTVLAYMAAFLITSAFSFTLNKWWAFKDTRREGVHVQFVVFVALTLVGLGLQTGVFALLLVPLHAHGRLGRNIAALPGIPISVLWNFTAYRRWAFTSSARST